ncbi:VOC family protein [Micromonospora sp. M12]
MIDCPNPRALAAFYAELLGVPFAEGDTDDDWVVLGGPPGHQPRLAFQQALNLRQPAWPDPERPQQFHLDVTVDDIEAAERPRSRSAPGGCRGGRGFPGLRRPGRPPVLPLLGLIRPPWPRLPA